VDIDPLTSNLSIERLSEKLSDAEQSGRLPKVVIPVHLSGQSCDMESIFKLSQQYGFRVIEDASHAIGGRYQNQPIGNCRYSDITVFSFHPVKIITTGEGGIAVTNDPELAEKMIRHRSHGITNKHEFMFSRPEDEIWNYQQINIGYNYRMTEMQAALGLSQMSRLDEFVERRHQIAKKYDNAFEECQIISPTQHPDTFSSYHLYPIRVRESKTGKTQRMVYDYLIKAGIMVNLHYIPIYLQPFYEAKGFQRGYCMEVELYFKETISLPIYSSLSDEQQDYVVKTLMKFI
jgi:dTDP-4-amino-4,6-dideoxygalactose transaminase